MLTAQEGGLRKLGWAAGANPLLINDADLTDLGPYWDGMLAASQIDSTQRAMLEPYRQARMAQQGEITHLLALSVIGTSVVPGDPTQGVNGVTVPLGDTFFLTGTELTYLETQRLTYNGMIKQAVATHGDGRVAVADFDGFFTNLATTSPISMGGSAITYDFNPPSGMWSVDGLLPNGRGYVLMANKYIEAINNTFGASVPKGNPNDVPGVRLPVMGN
jgi:hypothetical protein